MREGNSAELRSPAVSLQDVSKRFRLNPERDRSLMTLVRRPVDRLLGRKRREAAWFWPLRDVSLAIAPGESLGVLGENGSGKSTLLKLIAGILSPTYGSLEINGRIAALLELGAGFHPDLSGRENIYLNGSVLGLRRREINKYINDIVEFAAIGEFIDMPVKFYSSGMRVRLGFSIATFVRPDIMLVDEVLAVGDEDFQRKCVLAFHDFRRRGGTLVLVSHSLELIREMCSRAVWLDGGHIQADGPTGDVIATYLESVYEREHQRSRAKQPGEPTAEQSAADAAKDGWGSNRWGDAAVVFESVRILDANGTDCRFFYTGDSMTIEAEYRVTRALEDPPQVGFAFIRQDGIWVYGTNTAIEQIGWSSLSEGGQGGMVKITVPVLSLLPGEYYLDVSLQNPRGGDHDFYRGALRFAVRSLKRDVGVARIPSQWSFRR